MKKSKITPSQLNHVNATSTGSIAVNGLSVVTPDLFDSHGNYKVQKTNISRPVKTEPLATAYESEIAPASSEIGSNAKGNGTVEAISVQPSEKRSAKRELKPAFARLISVKQVATMLGASISSVWRWTKEQEAFPKPVKMGGGSTRWRIEDIENYIDQCR